MRYLNYRWLLPALLIIMLAACEQSQQQPTAGSTNIQASDEISTLAPDFTLTDLQGRKVTLSQYRGKVVIVNFWATWCPPCREEMPSMESLYRRFKDQDLVLLAINVEEDGGEAVNDFLKGKDYNFTILLDTTAEVQENYQVFQFPETFIIDRNGNLVDKIVGGRNWMSGTLLNRINFLLNG